jgi:hypothetical protein
MQTHDLCWDAWRTMGSSYLCEPDQYAVGFRTPDVRTRVAEIVRHIAENDRRTLQALQKCEDLL